MLVVGATLIATVTAYVVSSLLPRTYESETRLLVGQALEAGNPDVDLFQAAISLAQTYADIAEGPTVQQRVIDKLGLDVSREEFAGLVRVRALRDRPFISITAGAGDPEVAAATAQGVADELLAIAPAIGSGNDDAEFLEEEIAAVREEIATLRADVTRLLAISPRTAAQQAALEARQVSLGTLREVYAGYLARTAGAEANRLAIVDAPVVPDEPAAPRPPLNAAIAGLLALLATLGFAVLADRLDDRVRTADDVERVAGLPTLASVLRMPGDQGREPFYRLATVLYPRSPAAEAFRSLRTNIEFANLDTAFRTLVVTSSQRAEGKTVVASNLAVAFAQSGRRTILVDADLRLPAVHAMFGLAGAPGLTDMVRSDELSIDSVAQPTEIPNLLVIPAGTIPPNPAELLGSHRMELITERLTASADVVILDTPPAAVVTDAAILAAHADATILVVEPMRSTERVVRRGRESLAKVNARVIGVVLNKVPRHLAESATYYGRYEPGDEPAGPETQRPADAAPATTPERTARSRSRSRRLDPGDVS